MIGTAIGGRSQVGQWRKEIQAQAKIAVRLDPLHRTARRSGIEPVAAREPPRNPGRCIVNFCFLGEFYRKTAKKSRKLRCRFIPLTRFFAPLCTLIFILAAIQSGFVGKGTPYFGKMSRGKEKCKAIMPLTTQRELELARRFLADVDTPHRGLWTLGGPAHGTPLDQDGPPIGSFIKARPGKPTSHRCLATGSSFWGLDGAPCPLTR